MLTISKPLSAIQAQAYHSKEFTSAEQAYYGQKGEVFLLASSFEMPIPLLNFAGGSANLPLPNPEASGSFTGSGTTKNGLLPNCPLAS